MFHFKHKRCESCGKVNHKENMMSSKEYAEMLSHGDNDYDDDMSSGLSEKGYVCQECVYKLGKKYNLMRCPCGKSYIKMEGGEK